MTFDDAASSCHVRSAIYRLSDPARKLYWKNHPLTLREQVPAAEQLAHDWLEYDPREGELVPYQKH